MLRLPAEKGAGAGDIELVMVVRKVDHPWFDERLFIQHLVFQPGARFRQGFWNFTRFPLPGMKLLCKEPLHFVVTQGLRLTNQQRQLFRQFAALLDQ